MFVALIASLFATSAAFPADINYAHNISLNYDGQQLTNLDSINNLTGMDSEMAASLKEAINKELPHYLAVLNGTAETTTMSPEVEAFFNRKDLVNFHVDILNDPQASPASASETHPAEVGAADPIGTTTVSPPDESQSTTVAPSEASATTTVSVEGVQTVVTTTEVTVPTTSFESTTGLMTTVSSEVAADHPDATTITQEVITTTVVVETSDSTTTNAVSETTTAHSEETTIAAQ